MKIAVLSDIHGNHYALDSVLKECERTEVHSLLVLGDIVGYYYHPEKVLELLNEWEYHLIRGNHENLLGDLIEGKVEAENLRKKYGSGHQLALQNLSEADRINLLSAPGSKVINIGGITFGMYHGSPWDVGLYLYPDSDRNLLNKADVPGVDFVLIGHSHYPFVFKTQSGLLINAGSVGQSRLRGGVANWVLINTQSRSVESRATPYDTTDLLKEVERTDPDVPYLTDILKRNNS